MPAAVRLVGEHDTRLWRFLHHYADRVRQAADFSAGRQVGVDETSAKQGQNYSTLFSTLFCDLVESRTLFVTEGRDASTYGFFRLDLLAHTGQPNRIKLALKELWTLSPALAEAFLERW